MSGEFVNTDSTRYRGDDNPYAGVIQHISEQGICPFCPNHLHAHHKEPILDEGEHWLATPNMYPYEGAAHHLLLIHREHIENVSEMTDEAWLEVRAMMVALAKRLNIKGASLLMRYGETRFTGASVSHLHAQLVAGDGNPDTPAVVTRVG